MRGRFFWRKLRSMKGNPYSETSEKVRLFFESFLEGIFDFLTRGHKNRVSWGKVFDFLLC